MKGISFLEGSAVNFLWVVLLCYEKRISTIIHNILIIGSTIVCPCLTKVESLLGYLGEYISFQATELSGCLF